jgi:hypothetical protein
MRYFSHLEIRDFWRNKWEEARVDSYSLSIGNTTGNATLVGYIDAEDLALAIASILGYSVCIKHGLHKELYRVAPACHPRVRNLYASSVRVIPYAFMNAPMGKVELGQGEEEEEEEEENNEEEDISGGEVPVPGNPNKQISPSLHSQYIDPMALEESFNKIAYTTTYKKLRLEIDFSEFVGVVFASNDQPGFASEFYDKEYKRYTKTTFDYNLEILQMDNVSSLVFDAGPAKEQSFPTPVGIMLPQAKLNIKWMWVPHEFICDDPKYYGKAMYNQNIQSKLGKVNEKDFLGFKAGTLLFTAFKTEPIIIPVSDADTNCIVMKLAWNINFEFSYLNTVAAESYPYAPEWAIRGHNVFPFRGNRKFYPASIRKEKTQVPGNHLYEATDFSTIFRTLVEDI